MVSEDPPWIDNYVRYLVEKYFGQCGFQEDAFKELKSLPTFLSRKIGGEPQNWINHLSDSNQAARRLNLISGAVEYAVEKALSQSKRTGIPFCKYLENALYKKWMSNWIAGYLKGMIPMRFLDPD